VSAHNREPEMRPHTSAEAAADIATIERWQACYLAARGRRLVYASDEYYLLAARPFPALADYDACAQHENGIGMARTFEAEVRAALAGDEIETTGGRSGFFAWVDGAPAAGYRAPRTQSSDPVGGSPTVTANDPPVMILTGTLGAQALEPLLPELPGNVALLPVEN